MRQKYWEITLEKQKSTNIFCKTYNLAVQGTARTMLLQKALRIHAICHFRRSVKPFLPLTSLLKSCPANHLPIHYGNVGSALKTSIRLRSPSGTGRFWKLGGLPPDPPSIRGLENTRPVIPEVNFSVCNHSRYRGPKMAVQTIRFGQRLGKPVMGKSEVFLSPDLLKFTAISHNYRSHPRKCFCEYFLVSHLLPSMLDCKAWVCNHLPQSGKHLPTKQAKIFPLLFIHGSSPTPPP